MKKYIKYSRAPALLPLELAWVECPVVGGHRGAGRGPNVIT